MSERDGESQKLSDHTVREWECPTSSQYHSSINSQFWEADDILLPATTRWERVRLKRSLDLRHNITYASTDVTSLLSGEGRQHSGKKRGTEKKARK